MDIFRGVSSKGSIERTKAEYTENLGSDMLNKAEQCIYLRQYKIQVLFKQKFVIK